VSGLSPGGTARSRFLVARGLADDGPRSVVWQPADPELQEPAYLGWEIGRCAPDLDRGARHAVELLAASCVEAMHAGSTRVPTDMRLRLALAAVGAEDSLPAVRAVLERARTGDPAVTVVLGPPGARTPLVFDGEWVYAERMRVLEERFCARVGGRVERRLPSHDGKVTKVLRAVADGPPALTDEQKRAVRKALTSPFALVTGGPGTGKTTIVVALLRALSWTGVTMEAIAIAAPTGKAAQRLQEALASGLAAAARDMAEAALSTIPPEPQTLHRLLGWSPSTGRFARHENDPLPHRVVVVDEASMIDLAAMDRLLRALRPDARLVLLGDADQLPSVEAGAVFRDLCAALGAERLTVNLRVASDPSAQRIVDAARAVNAGRVDSHFTAAVTTRRTAEELCFEGVEHLAAPWTETGEALLERWWSARVASLEGFAERVSRPLRMRDGQLEESDQHELRALFEHYGRARLLCATRGRAFETGAEAINDALLARLRGGARPRRWRAVELAPGTPVLFERNDYERRLFNGDQGLVVRVDTGDGSGARPTAVFPRRGGFVAFPVDSLTDLVPAFAMTVHKAQGSEFDHVGLVLPEADMPLLTRELVYTAMTRARRSVVLVGELDLLVRTVSRAIERHSGVAERLASPEKCPLPPQMC
jgi:exodeoxyribonuclease V alpha subunit